MTASFDGAVQGDTDINDGIRLREARARSEIQRSAENDKACNSPHVPSPQACRARGGSRIKPLTYMNAFGPKSPAATHSGKCLDVSGESKDPGATLTQWTCHSGANQRFRMSGDVARPTPMPSIGSWSWRRHAGNPILRANNVATKPLGRYPLIADPSVIYDEGKFKMWLNYGGADFVLDPNSTRVRVAYAESSDGYSWKTVSAPALDVGSTGAWDRTNAEIPSVIVDPRLPQGHPRKYRMYYGGLDSALEKDFEQMLKNGMGYGIGLAFSPDGQEVYAPSGCRVTPSD